MSAAADAQGPAADATGGAEGVEVPDGENGGRKSARTELARKANRA